MRPSSIRSRRFYTLSNLSPLTGLMNWKKTSGPVWERESFDRLIRSESDLQEKFNYITRNPWDAGVADQIQDYPWVWYPSKEASRPAAEMGTPAACAPRKIRVRDLIEYIDWSPFFHAWELRGRYPAIFDDPKMGKQARELFDDTQELLERIAAKNLLIPRGVYALWPANAVGDDVHVYADDARTEKIATFYFLRQQMQKPAAQFNHGLADYIAPASSAAQTSAVTTGSSRRIRGLHSRRGRACRGVQASARRLQRDHDQSFSGPVS